MKYDAQRTHYTQYGIVLNALFGKLFLNAFLCECRFGHSVNDLTKNENERKISNIFLCISKGNDHVLFFFFSSQKITFKKYADLMIKFCWYLRRRTLHSVRFELFFYAIIGNTAITATFQHVFCLKTWNFFLYC